MTPIHLAAVLGLAGAGPVQLPSTFNFRNLTSDRIIQNVAETPSNEKEVEFGDFDNDQDLDVVIAVAYSDFGQRKNKLYRNDKGVFTEVSQTVPLFTTGAGDVARNAFFRDYDGDGWLDIIVVCDNNTGGDPGRTKIWINQHAGGVHTGWSEEGLSRLGNGTGGAACSGTSVDPDMDGDFDLYVGNYPGPSQDTMYFNDDLAPGFFDEVTSTHVPADSAYTVDISAADMNGDGKMDLLVSNHAPNFIYYNDNLGAGTEVGDYRYTGSTQNLGTGSGENAMEAGDFDNDGDNDIYWSNRAAGGGDRILRNDENDGSNRAVFTTLDILPASVTGVTSRKATVADIDGDGRVDIVVGKDISGNLRPTILRNTSVGGTISFVDWTPAPAFPTGSTHRGWHAAVFDSDGDGRSDVFLGGWSNDHLFLQSGPIGFNEDDLTGGTLPDVFNDDPVAVLGSAGLAESDTYTVNGLGAGAFISVVLTGADDYRLEILNSGGTVLATSDRGGTGVEEAIQYDPASMPSTVRLRVTVQACGSVHDLDGDCQVSTPDLIILLGAWGKNPGHPADFNGDNEVSTADLLEMLANWGPSPYVMEALARDG